MRIWWLRALFIFICAFSVPIIAHTSPVGKANNVTESCEASLSLGPRIVQTMRAMQSRARARATIGSNLQLRLWEEMETPGFNAQETQQLLEKTLRSGKVVSMRSAGNWDAKFVVFENGIEAVWKPVGRSSRVSPKKEVAAYLVDSELKFNLVPITLLRTIDGNLGSMQVRISGAREGRRAIPDQIGLLDILIANRDRHPNLNWLTVASGRVVAIDHDSHTFWGYGTQISGLLEQIRYLNDEIRDLKTRLEGIKDETEKTALAQAIRGWEFSRDHALEVKKTYENALRSRPDVIARLETVSVVRWRELLSLYLESTEMDEYLIRRQETLLYVDQVRKYGEILVPQP